MQNSELVLSWFWLDKRTVSVYSDCRCIQNKFSVLGYFSNGLDSATGSFIWGSGGLNKRNTYLHYYCPISRAKQGKVFNTVFTDWSYYVI